jgi:Putative MetA-pathway of phenol degradation
MAGRSTAWKTNFFTSASDNKFSYQSTLVIEKEFGERSFLFVEYVGDFPSVGRNSQLINSGGGYRIDDHHQIDFHVGVGLDRNAPNYIFGVGYSFRLDGFLQSRDHTLTPSPGASLTRR